MNIKKLSICLITATSLLVCPMSTTLAVTPTSSYRTGTEFTQGNIRYARMNDNKTVMVIGLVDETVSTLAIPEKVNDENVSVIGSEAFSECSNLKLVTTPKSINSIQANAFKDCTKLESVYIHSSEKAAYNKEIFNGCKNLKNIFYEGTQAQFNQSFTEVWDGTIKYTENDQQLSTKAGIHYNSNIPYAGEEQNDEIANTPIGGTCYIPYNETINGKRYLHPYQVVFRTETDTYLLGLFPYKNCSWNLANTICQELENNISIDCNMVGVPSSEDIEFFYDNGSAIPVTMEMWTNTASSPTASKACFRNSKGSYYSTKNKSDECGLCALIKVSTPQNDNSLLSKSYCSQEEYNAQKTQLELEESEYNLAIAKTKTDQDSVAESEAAYRVSYASYLNAAIKYNEITVNYYGTVARTVKGDSDGDGQVNTKDATTILKYAIGTQNLTEDSYGNADINGDGAVNAKDATAILKMVVGIR